MAASPPDRRLGSGQDSNSHEDAVSLSIWRGGDFASQTQLNCEIDPPTRLLRLFTQTLTILRIR